MRTGKKLAITILSSSMALAAAFCHPAFAGRGGSPQAIQSAIAANSVDAIQAELEKAEYLVCAGCTDMVLPLIDHSSYRVRQAAAWWLARRATSHQVYVAMLTRLSQPDSVQARDAADVLGEFKYAASIPALSAALSNPIYTGEARAAMAQALGAIGRNTAAAGLQQALADADPVVKAASLQALRTVAGFHDGTVAIPLLGDADAGVRGEAAVTIGMMHTQAAASALVQVLEHDPSALARRKAAWSLGEIGAPASIAGAPLTLAAGSDANAFVRSLAAAAVTKLTAN
jgi:HEAT repeat protein